MLRMAWRYKTLLYNKVLLLPFGHGFRVKTHNAIKFAPIHFLLDLSELLRKALWDYSME